MTIEFLDQNGKALEIGDEIEYWSPSYKDWLKAEVREIHAVRKNEHVDDGQGGWKYAPKTSIKIKVAKWHVVQGRYLNYDYLNLKKSEVIRKVV